MNARIWDPESETIKYVPTNDQQAVLVAQLELLDRIASALEKLVPNAFTGRP